MRTISCSSQHLHGGFQACTSICLHAALRLIRLNDDEIAHILQDNKTATILISSFIQEGINISTRVAKCQLSAQPHFFKKILIPFGITRKQSVQDICRTLHDEPGLPNPSRTEIINVVNDAIVGLKNVDTWINELDENSPVIMTCNGHSTLLIKRLTTPDEHSNERNYSLLWLDPASNLIHSTLKTYEADTEQQLLIDDLVKIWGKNLVFDSTTVTATNPPFTNSASPTQNK